MTGLFLGVAALAAYSPDPGAHVKEDCLECSQSGGTPFNSDLPRALAETELYPHGLSGIISMNPSLFPCPCPPFTFSPQRKTSLSTLWNTGRRQHTAMQITLTQTSHVRVTWPGISGPLPADQPVGACPPASGHFRVKVAFPFANLFPLWPLPTPQSHPTPLFSQNRQAE